MFDSVMGLPVHALVVHAVVVLVPLASFGVIAMAVVPRWRERFGVAVLAIAVAGLAAVPVATRSGGKLEDRVGAGGVVAQQIESHKEMGELVIWPTIAMVVTGFALVLLHRRGRQGALMTVVAVVAVIASVGAIAQVAVAGHRGSKAVWSCTVDPKVCQQ